jgi:hypothetical protein
MGAIEAHSCDRDGCSVTEHGNKLGSWLVAVVNSLSKTVAIAPLNDARLLPPMPDVDDDTELLSSNPVRLYELCGFSCLMQVVSPLYTVRNGIRRRVDELPPVDDFSEVANDGAAK